MDTIRIEISEKTNDKPEWFNVYVNEELMISTDNRESVIKFITTLLRLDVTMI